MAIDRFPVGMDLQVAYPAFRVRLTLRSTAQLAAGRLPRPLGTPAGETT
jgi:hypothetical protein